MPHSSLTHPARPGARRAWAAYLSSKKPAAPAPPGSDLLKKGETLEVGPGGQRGVWRSIDGRAIFIPVKQGESVPQAVKRTEAERGAVRLRGKNPGGAPRKPAGARGILEARPSASTFGAWSPEAERGYLARMVEQQAELNKMINTHVAAASVTGSPLELPAAELRKRAPNFFTKALLDGAQKQAAERIAFTQWAESEGGKVKSVRLYRGIPSGELSGDETRFGYVSSWTSDRSVAARFADAGGKVYEKDVPIEDILLSPRSADDLADESEYLVRTRASSGATARGFARRPDRKSVV